MEPSHALRETGSPRVTQGVKLSNRALDLNPAKFNHCVICGLRVPSQTDDSVCVQCKSWIELADAITCFKLSAAQKK